MGVMTFEARQLRVMRLWMGKYWVWDEEPLPTARWLQHFSMEPSAELVVSDDKFKGLPAGGLTFMARASLLFDNQLHSLANR